MPKSLLFRAQPVGGDLSNRPVLDGVDVAVVHLRLEVGPLDDHMCGRLQRGPVTALMC